MRKEKKKMNEEMMFIACNVPKFLEEQMNKMKDALTGGMNEDNLKGFEYAVDTMLSILRQIIRAAEMDDEILVHSDKIADENELEEFDLHDLLELYGCRVMTSIFRQAESHSN